MLLTRIKRFIQDIKEDNQSRPPREPWIDLYIYTNYLSIQGKHEEALKVLEDGKIPEGVDPQEVLDYIHKWNRGNAKYALK